ncbi:MAG: SxtJ family membrane protein [Candidatus Neomarinimicrobiota bacterium]
MNWIREIPREMRTLDISNKAIRKFGVVIAVGLGSVGTFVFLRTNNLYSALWLWGIGLLFLILGFILPPVARPFYRLWMLIAYLLGGFVSQIILTLLFYFVLTPIGLVLRLMGKDLLSKNYGSSQESYWVKKDLSNITNDQYRKMY